MAHSEVAITDRDVAAIPAAPSARISHATWRYIGDRVAADQAYCARFSVTLAPEPIVALGGAWAYTLPGEQTL